MITTKVHAAYYSPTTLKVEESSSLENFTCEGKGDSILWLDVSNYQKLEELSPLQKSFGLHELALEDCFHARQRPKIDDYSKYLFIVARMVSEKEGTFSEGLQLGIFMGKDFVITVHSQDLHKLEDILEDLKKRKPEQVASFSSFLLYTILDNVVDDFEDTVRKEEEMEAVVGAEVLKERPPEKVLNSIYTTRSNLILTRRLLRPQADVVDRLARGNFPIIDKEARLFMRDIYDHTLRTLDRIDSLLDMNMGSLSIHLSAMSNRMNNVMKLLTVISTIGVPLTVLVGWYGMNFQEMPELHWTNGYLIVIFLAAIIVTGTVLLFRKKGLL